MKRDAFLRLPFVALLAGLRTNEPDPQAELEHPNIVTSPEIRIHLVGDVDWGQLVWTER